MAITTTISDKAGERSVTMSSAEKLLTVLGQKKQVWTVLFNGATTTLSAGSEASLDNLQDNALTVEMWIRNDAHILYSSFVDKGPNGLLVQRINATTLYCVMPCATTAAAATAAFLPDGIWRHLALTWDDAGDRKLRVWKDGVLVGTSGAGVGAVKDDSATIMTFGCQYGLVVPILGAIGWHRVSNSVRYSATFTPPSRLSYPANDVNTVRLFKVNEGTGTTIIDYSTNAQNETLANGSWSKN